MPWKNLKLTTKHFRWIAIALAVIVQIAMFLSDKTDDQSAWIIAISSFVFIACVLSNGLRETIKTTAYCYLIAPALMILSFSTVVVKTSLGGSPFMHGRIMEVIPTIISYFPAGLEYTIPPMILSIATNFIFTTFILKDKKD